MTDFAGLDAAEVLGVERDVDGVCSSANWVCRMRLGLGVFDCGIVVDGMTKGPGSE